jgi:spore germination protein YaaH
LVLYAFLAGCLSYPSYEIYSQEDSTKTVKKEESGLKKDLSTIEKLLSFKNFFHHSDSAKLARRYIRWHKKIAKGKYDYPYKIDYKKAGLKVERYKRNDTNKLNYEVMGWYPSWDADLHKTLNYSLLSTIAYFSYEVDPHTGKPISTNEWETTPVVDSAKANGTRILLTVTNFGNANNKKFLKNNKAVVTLIDQLKTLLQKRGADGVCINFEGVQKSLRNDFSSFITLLNQELKKANKDYVIYMTVPAVDWEKYLDFEVLIPVVDQFTIMGYDYYGVSSKVAGPVDPLNSGKTWDPFNLTTSVDFYLANEVPASQLILALPFYGYIWDTKSGQLGSKVDKFVGPRTYDYIKTTMEGANAPMRFDTISQSAWYSYVVTDDKGARQFRQCWFDNEVSMAAKLNLIIDKKIKGMGIWALGYDKGYHDYWKVIESSFCNPETAPERNNGGSHAGHIDGAGSNSSDGADRSPGDTTTPPLVTKPTTPENTTVATQGFWDKIWKNVTNIDDLLQKISDNKSILLFILAFVVLFGGVGFIIAMFNPNTRMFFFGNTAFTVYYMAIVLLFLAVVLQWKKIIDEKVNVLVFGFIIGAVLLFFISKFINKIHRDVP